MFKFKTSLEFEYVCYFDITKSGDDLTIVAIDANGNFIGHIAVITHDGIYLCDGMPCGIPIAKDKKGRAMLLNMDLAEFQKNTKEDLPEERLE